MRAPCISLSPSVSGKGSARARETDVESMATDQIWGLMSDCEVGSAVMPTGLVSSDGEGKPCGSPGFRLG